MFICVHLIKLKDLKGMITIFKKKKLHVRRKDIMCKKGSRVNTPEAPLAQ